MMNIINEQQNTLIIKKYKYCTTKQITMIIKIVIGYWILSTIIGIYWMIKHPSFGDEKEYFTLGEVLSHILPCALLSWVLLPMGLLELIKFKR